MDASDSLGKYDVKLLRYLKKAGLASVNQVQKRFPRLDAIEYRIDHLIQQMHVNQKYAFVKQDTGETIPKKTGLFYITEAGKKALQDHLKEQRDEKRKNWHQTLKGQLTISMIIYLLLRLVEFLLLRVQEMGLEWLS
ncbi:MAG: hypothetical protein LBS36_01840 [Oscillospiraceae bacterium]|jgi:hypothetical protein|nr:hypothetical protein [Oscillospiraceae bacterium]